MKVQNKKPKNTRGFKEPLFTIEHDGRVLAVLGANSSEQALGRADAIRHEISLPRRELLQSHFVASAPIHAPFFSKNYFFWLDSLDDGTIGKGACPVCGR